MNPAPLKFKDRLLSIQRPSWLPPYIPELQGLRGLAVLAVLIYHCHPRLQGTWLYDGSLWGWAGVNLFFVLSGFLITSILLEARDKPYYFRNFYARRALRIWPAYLLVLAICYLNAPWFIGLPVFDAIKTAPWWAYLLFLQNLFHLALPPAIGPDLVARNRGAVLLHLGSHGSGSSPSVDAGGAAGCGPRRKSAHAHASLRVAHSHPHPDSPGWNCAGKPAGPWPLHDSLGPTHLVLAWSLGIRSRLHRDGNHRRRHRLPRLGARTRFRRCRSCCHCLNTRGPGDRSSSLGWTGARNPINAMLRRGPLAFYGRISYGLYMIHIMVFIYFGWFDLKMDPYGTMGNLAIVGFRLVVATACATALWYGFESQILKFKRFF